MEEWQPNRVEDVGGSRVPEAPKKRQPKRQLRQLMLDTGRTILDEEGIETASTNLTFKRVFDRVEQDTGRHLTNASVIKRIWENQADYQADVLVAVAHDEHRPEIEETLDSLKQVLDDVDRTTVAGRLRGMSELCRVAGAASQDVISNSSNWSLWISVVAIATSSSNNEQRDRMCDALTEGFRTVSDIWEGIYAGLAAFLGLRVREPRTLHQFADALSSLSEGDSLRQHILRESTRFTCRAAPEANSRSGPSTPRPSRHWPSSSSSRIRTSSPTDRRPLDDLPG